MRSHLSLPSNAAVRSFLSRFSLPTPAPDQTLASAGLVTLCTLLALGLALASGVPTPTLAAPVVGGLLVTVAIGGLGTDRALAMLVGGACLPLGIAAWVAGIAAGIVALGLPAAALLGCLGLLVGLGWTGMLTGALDRASVAAAVSRYLLALFGVFLLGGVVVLFVGGLLTAITGIVVEFTTVAIDALTETARPVQAAGPTLVLLGGSFLLLQRVSRRVSVPYVLTEETRESAEEALDDLASVSSVLAVALASFGMLTTFAVLAELIANPSPLWAALGLVGSAPVRWLAFGQGVACAVALVALWGYRLTDWLSVSQVVTAVFPLLGLLGGAVLLVLALLQSGELATLRQLPVLAEVVADIEGGVGVAALLAAAMLFAGGIFQTLLYLLYGRLPSDAPAIGVLGVGLAVLPVALVLLDGSVLVVMAALALAVLTVDAGRYGATLAAEVGRTAGLRTELTHTTAGVGVGVVCVPVAWVAAGNQLVSVPPLSLLTYLLGIAGLVVVLFAIGRQLSA
ncbi:hypothetical protein [Natronomonas sp. EA1]|uniref:hypothetical protein n=1 Tax=Natronomonas sp. EA1 TaxID=3421655 RepID=UPI003EC1286D